MLLTDDEIRERIESPLNLLNRLKNASRPDKSNSDPQGQSPCLPPKSEDIIEDLEDKINNTTARSKAMGLMLSAMDELKQRLPEIQKPETLANLAYNMSRVVSSQEQNRNNHASVASQIIVYAPQVQRLENYDIIDVTE